MEYMRMRLSLHWGSHLPVLIKLMSMTDGPVLEMGGGFFSSPYLHWACYEKKRELVTYENVPKFYDIEKCLESDFHKIIKVETFDEALIERPWDIVLIDQWPPERRKEDIKRLANWAKYIVVHDTERNQNHHYHYDEIYPLFKYNYKFRGAKPHTSILSNFVEVNNIIK
jgi:hypothetical protein